MAGELRFRRSSPLGVFLSVGLAQGAFGSVKVERRLNCVVEHGNSDVVRIQGLDVELRRTTAVFVKQEPQNAVGYGGLTRGVVAKK